LLWPRVLPFYSSVSGPWEHGGAATKEVARLTAILGSQIPRREGKISGGVERAAMKSEKTIKKRRLFVEVSTERALSSSKQITITGTWEHTDEMNKIRTVNII
jgi:hypothetical protein